MLTEQKKKTIGCADLQAASDSSASLIYQQMSPA